MSDLKYELNKAETNYDTFLKHCISNFGKVRVVYKSDGHKLTTEVI